ncbi:hypothetical protein [Deinococcus aquatilis]|uniref:hypothetical protein n=1 Tax=Deinococcus aquatilis TaxID=519440 RepID=UPI00036FFBE1|nr:hypothetical protein [Deinococcus aquatilis]
MDWTENSRSRLLARLQTHLDLNGDLAPPWARFPDYERHTIGWRMGEGEDWIELWSAFLEQLPQDHDTRTAYLQRHPPAPVSWADTVHHVLFPLEQGDDNDSDEDDLNRVQRRTALLEQGLIASDIAYSTWLGQQTRVCWPWEHNETPEDAARYSTREFWFWSRQVAALRRAGGWTPPTMPDAWQACRHALESGEADAIQLHQGLLSLAVMFCAGQVWAPWQLGLSLDEFEDSFENDMGYVDAFHLWGMSAFDDAGHLRRYLMSTQAPAAWAVWIEGELFLD